MKKMYVVLGCFITFLCFSAFTSIDKPEKHEDFKPANLKVLPKNISSDELEAIMKSFNKSLGVKCSYCHAPKQNGEKGLDFASDENPKKHISRNMLKMSAAINKKYFKNHIENGVLTQIGCATCHNGNTRPEMREVHK